MIGIDNVLGSAVDFAMACTAPSMDSGETCTSDIAQMSIAPGLNSCFRAGCTGPQQRFVDVYVTMQSNRSADQRAAISYQTTSPFRQAT